MSYSIIYTKTAAKDIKKLDPIIKKKLKKKIEKYLQNPLLYTKKLSDSKIGDFRWRIGNYRIVFDIHQRTIVVLRIAHRKDVYQF